MPLPVMETPFERIAINMEAPFRRARWVTGLFWSSATIIPGTRRLSHCARATEHVAEALVNFFAQVGLPREILSDQGTNFTSELMK